MIFGWKKDPRWVAYYAERRAERIRRLNVKLDLEWKNTAAAMLSNMRGLPFRQAQKDLSGRYR